MVILWSLFVGRGITTWWWALLVATPTLDGSRLLKTNGQSRRHVPKPYEAISSIVRFPQFPSQHRSHFCYTITARLV